MGIRSLVEDMDGLHLPAIVELRERSGRCSGSVMNKNITEHERTALTGSLFTGLPQTMRARGIMEFRENNKYKAIFARLYFSYFSTFPHQILQSYQFHYVLSGNFLFCLHQKLVYHSNCLSF